MNSVNLISVQCCPPRVSPNVHKCLCLLFVWVNVFKYICTLLLFMCKLTVCVSCVRPARNCGYMGVCLHKYIQYRKHLAGISPVYSSVTNDVIFTVTTRWMYEISSKYFTCCEWSRKLLFKNVDASSNRKLSENRGVGVMDYW